MLRPHSLLGLVFAFIVIVPSGATAQEAKAKTKKKSPPPPFAWVSPAPEQRIQHHKLPAENLSHGTFRSASMDSDVGYHIYLPSGYESAPNQRFPVVYYLHGGRPGGEYKSVTMAKFFHEHMESGAVEPTIYVFPNGGPLSWYDVSDKADAMGEKVLVEELIPHIDATYRTIAERGGRAIEGFSQGGRGTTRIAFRHPQLFVSAAPGGSGYEPEMRIRDNDGWESESLRILPVGNNCWDLADVFSKHANAPKLEPLLWVGTKGFNYEYNLKFSKHLTALGIPHKLVVTEGAKHSASQCYQARGLEIMLHHQQRFVRP